MKEKRPIKFNINNYMSVKLTEYGMQLLKEENSHLLGFVFDGVLKTTAWKIFAFFGKYLGKGMKDVFDTTQVVIREYDFEIESCVTCEHYAIDKDNHICTSPLGAHTEPRQISAETLKAEKCIVKHNNSIYNEEDKATSEKQEIVDALISTRKDIKNWINEYVDIHNKFVDEVEERILAIEKAIEVPIKQKMTMMP